MVKARITFGKYYRLLNQIGNAKREFKKAQKLLKRYENAKEEELRELALIAYIECKIPERFEQPTVFECHQLKLSEIESSESSLVFKKTVKTIGWTIEVTRDMAPGR